MEGRALTATELALEGDVAPSTASSHLAKLSRAGLVTIARQGRHRYFRLASVAVATALESLMVIAPRAGAGARRWTGDEELRRARVCYDHLAGEAAVRLLAALRERRWVRGVSDAIAVTSAGEEWFRGLGVDCAALRRKRRRLCRVCLDWSERQFHLAGALGAALLDRVLALRLARRETGSRALIVSPRGAAFLESLQLPGAARHGSPDAR
jgi:DNA-binding transcriptional ArsR family regulator